MKKIVIESMNEVGHSLLIAKLTENDIAYTERILTDTTFPSLNTNTFGELTISNDFENRLDAIFNEVKREDYRIRIIERKSSAQKYGKIGLVVYSIVMTLLFLKYWHINNLNTIDKNFNIEWNHSNAILNYTDKANNNLVNRYIDSNYDNNFERSETYVNGVGPTAVFYDRDENGYYEDILYYDFSGNLIGISKDYDSDGSYDYCEMILEAGDTLKFIDGNRNGAMELTK